MLEAEFNSTYKQYQEKLIHFAYRLTKNQIDAEDLLQDTALKAYRNRERFKKGTNFLGWMRVIMRNTFINKFRAKKHRPKTIEKFDTLLNIYADDRPVFNHGISTLRLEEIQAAMEEVPDKFTEPFLLHYQGYKYHEIADHFGEPLGTVKSRIFHARKKLKERLHKKYPKANWK
ncbi:MAG: RNA polymerase sigma factor [Bacteroidota bacterium]